MFILFCKLDSVAVWLSCNMCFQSTSVQVSTGMGEHLQEIKLTRYITSHSGQLSLAAPLWVGTVSTNENWKVNGQQMMNYM